MLTYAVAVLYALGLWWSSTVLILYLNGRARRTFPLSLAATTLVTLAAFVGMSMTRNDTSLAGVYHAFTCGLIAWAWQIVTFYMGFITGPSKVACATNLRGWGRFVAAVRTCLYHEGTILLMAAGMTALLWRAANPYALWTFLVLWWMHTSAKLNVFFGVRNLGEEFIPEHLRYILSYMSRRGMNAFFPISISVSTVVTVLLVQAAAAAGRDTPEAAGLTMLAALMALAVLEHWLLVTPFDANVLWKLSARTAPVEATPRHAADALSPSHNALLPRPSRRGGDLAKLECV